MELSRLIEHPEEMNRETLYDLRALLALYPYYQTARLLMLQNLYLLHDPSFDEELRRAAIYITDRKKIFELVEAAHYQLKAEPNTSTTKDSSSKQGNHGEKHDRTSDLIDHFLGTIPMEVEEDKKNKKRKPTPADAAVDYVAYLMETEGEEEEEQNSRTIDLIDDFMEDGGFKLPKLEDKEEYKPEFTPELQQDCNNGESETSGVFTETLARIYIKQGKYERAHEIIDKLERQHPNKNGYHKDQLRFLEKLMANQKKGKKIEVRLQNKNKE